MKKAKREALERKGWKLGSADDFLDLSAEESAYIEMKIALSEKLRERRQLAEILDQRLARRGSLVVGFDKLP